MNTREYARKSIHILFGLFFILLVQFAGVSTSTLIIGLCLIAGTIISIALTRGHEFPFLRKIVEGVERENEKHFPGRAAVYFFISAVVLLVLFKNHPSIILASLCVQVFADSAAAIVGTTFGKHKIYKKKTLEGSSACLVVSIFCISLFFPIHIAIIAGIIATIVEILPLDDNLWVPIFTAATIRLLI